LILESQSQFQLLLPRAVKSISADFQSRNPVAPSIRSADELIRLILDFINRPCHPIAESCQIEFYFRLHVRRLLVLAIHQGETSIVQDVLVEVQENLKTSKLELPCTSEEIHIGFLTNTLEKLGAMFNKCIEKVDLSLSLDHSELQARWKRYISNRKANLVPLLLQFSQKSTWKSDTETRGIWTLIYLDILTFHPNKTAGNILCFDILKNFEKKMASLKKNDGYRDIQVIRAGMDKILRALDNEEPGIEHELSELDNLMKLLTEKQDYDRCSRNIEKKLNELLEEENCEASYSLLEILTLLSSCEKALLELKLDVRRTEEKIKNNINNFRSISRNPTNSFRLKSKRNERSRSQDVVSITQKIMSICGNNDKLSLSWVNASRNFAIHRGVGELWTQVLDKMVASTKHFSV
jgi:hypothetical protein